MELTILNQSFDTILTIDSFESLIWTERYANYGDFELYTPAVAELVDVIKMDYYVSIPDSDRLMIVEDIQIQTDDEMQSHLIVTGRSLESILERRIIWSLTTLTGDFQDAIKTLLTQNAMDPTVVERRISNFVFVESEDPTITDQEISMQITGDNLYEAIRDLCQSRNIGFKVTYSSPQFEYSHLTDENDAFITDHNGEPILTRTVGKMKFQLYVGKDKSYDQNTYPYVVFTPKMDNLVSNDYKESYRSFKNVGLVAGEDDGVNRRTRVAGDNTISGLDRREAYIDARDIQSEVDGETIEEEEYNALLDQRGLEKLTETAQTMSYSYELDPAQLYEYGVDYDNGDEVQIVNEFGIEAKTRIDEIIRTYDENGYRVYPTVGSIQNVSGSSSDPVPTQAEFNGPLVRQIRAVQEKSEVSLVSSVTASEQAAVAQTTADSALTNLTTVEDVVGVVTWAQTHGQEEMAAYINSHVPLVFLEHNEQHYDADSSTLPMGLTKISTNDIAIQWANLPSSKAGFLMNIGKANATTASDLRRIQFYVERDSLDTYVRSSGTGTWTAWKQIVSQKLTTTWSTPTVTSSRCAIQNGGYYQEGKRTYVQLQIKLASSMSANDSALQLFSDMPSAKSPISVLNVMVGAGNGGAGCYVNTSGKIFLKPPRDIGISTSDNVYITGVYTTA